MSSDDGWTLPDVVAALVHVGYVLDHHKGAMVFVGLRDVAIGPRLLRMDDVRKDLRKYGDYAMDIVNARQRRQALRRLVP